MSTGVDYAWGRPGAAALRHDGVVFACRYLSHDTTGKNLTPAEAQELSAEGIWIVVVWESTANRALDGYGAGAQDARAALGQAVACGMPSGRPIYFAVDFDASPSDQTAIDDYLDGAASVLGHDRVGIYGGYYPLKRALDGGHARWGWQATAWSGGQWDPRAQIRQLDQHTIGGVDCDDDQATTADYGQWRIGAAAPTPDPQEDEMPYGQLTDGPKAITPISLPKGRYKTIGFIADNGLQGLPPAEIRVAIDQGGGNWYVEQITVDSKQSQAVIVFPDQANTCGISVRREDAGDVHVAWEVS